MVRATIPGEINQDNDIVQQAQSSPKRGKFNTKMIGASGTMIFSGYYDEEYLSRLTGTQAADHYDQMRRSDGQINMLLTARKNPILTASKSIEPGHIEGARPERTIAR